MNAELKSIDRKLVEILANANVMCTKLNQVSTELQSERNQPLYALAKTGSHYFARISNDTVKALSTRGVVLPANRKDMLKHAKIQVEEIGSPPIGSPVDIMLEDWQTFYNDFQEIFEFSKEEFDPILRAYSRSHSDIMDEGILMLRNKIA
ncbi:hypothetical protein A9Q84_00925 [Halobacteriovorax marinus]|uniref:DUF2383 domain-containing protein n=1 Tax=Halobacteriovorax marinus TaxID=97084 RepID=A0A1Y5FHD7_9BACT|nr:hypothetical protein A9Q84_00925 [Halobacteriovorax marinus]